MASDRDRKRVAALRAKSRRLVARGSDGEARFVTEEADRLARQTGVRRRGSAGVKAGQGMPKAGVKAGQKMPKAGVKAGQGMTRIGG